MPVNVNEMDAFMAERMKELAAEKSAEQDTDRYTIYQIREGSPAGDPGRKPCRRL